MDSTRKDEVKLKGPLNDVTLQGLGFEIPVDALAVCNIAMARVRGAQFYELVKLLYGDVQQFRTDFTKDTRLHKD